MTQQYPYKDRFFGRIILMEKNVFGSLIADGYDDDTLVDILEKFNNLLLDVPEDRRKHVRLSIDSVSGYEGESHVEMKIYYPAE